MIVSCTGADGEDGACVFPEHGREHGADQGVAGAEVECEHAVEGGGGLLPERVSAGVAAYGADQAIDAVVVGNERGDESVDGGFVGDVDSVAGECRAGTGGFNKSVELGGITIGNSDVCAFRQKGERDGAAQAAGAAGDENQFSSEIDMHDAAFATA